MTSSLPRKCSTAELRRRIERVMGIEPTSPAWKAGVLPLNYTRTVGREGFEPPKAYAGRFTVCSLWPLGHLPSLSIILNRLLCLMNIYEPPRGLEPPTDWLQISCSTSWATVAIQFFENFQLTYFSMILSLPRNKIFIRYLLKTNDKRAKPHNLQYKYYYWQLISLMISLLFLSNFAVQKK